MDYNTYMNAHPHMREMMIWHTPYYPPTGMYFVYYILPWILVFAGTILCLSLFSKRGTLGKSSSKLIILCVALMSFLLLFYSINFRVGSTPGDTLGSRYMPYSIIKEGNFNLDEFPFLQDANYYTREQNGHWVSKYPPGAPVMALPVYIFPVLAGLPVDSPHVPCLEKLSASLLTALSAVFFFLVVRILLCACDSTRREGWALFLALIYGVATCSWSVSSSSLYQHAPAQLLLILAVYLLLRGVSEARFIKWAGLMLSAAAVCRPTAFVFALILSAYVLHRHRSQLHKFLLMALLPAILLVLHNYFTYGSIFSQSYADEIRWWGQPFYAGAFGSWFSPSRGLLIFTPIFIFSLIGVRKLWGRSFFGGLFLISGLYLGFLLICRNFGLMQKLVGQNKGFLGTPTSYILLIFLVGIGIWDVCRARGLFIGDANKVKNQKAKSSLLRYCAACAVFYPLLFSKWHMWYGGWSFGYRIMTEIVVFLCLMLVPIIPSIKKSKAWMSLFVLAVVISLVVQIVGAFAYDNDWNGRNNAHTEINSHQQNLWVWRDNQVAFYIRRLMWN